VRVATALFAGIPDLTSFAAVSKTSASLRADLSARSWRRVLKVSVGVTALQLGAAAPGGRWRPEEKTAYYHPGVPVKGGCSAPCLSPAAAPDPPPLAAATLIRRFSAPHSGSGPPIVFPTVGCWRPIPSSGRTGVLPTQATVAAVWPPCHSHPLF